MGGWRPFPYLGKLCNRQHGDPPRPRNNRGPPLSNRHSATTLLPEQAKPSRSMKRMVLPIRQFYLDLARRGSCQAALHRVSKPQVGDSSLTQSLRNLAIPYKLARTPIQVNASHVSPHTPLAI